MWGKLEVLSKWIQTSTPEKVEWSFLLSENNVLIT